MRRALSAVAAVALLLALGALAVMALPGAQGAALPAPVSAAPSAQAAGTPKLNVIAVPLDVTAQLAALTPPQNLDAPGLAALVGQGVLQVLEWSASPTGGTYRTYYAKDGEGDPFALKVGGVYRLVLEAGANDIVSFVGDVPDQGSVSFTLVRPTGAGCIMNDVSVPLDLGSIADAPDLADAIGNVSQVLEWNAAADPQSYRTYYAQDGEGDPFAVKIGYPYRVCLLAGGATTWPAP